MSRNRAAEARDKGNVLAAFELTQEFSSLIDSVAEALKASEGRCTRVQALERMGREGAKKILKKISNRT